MKIALCFLISYQHKLNKEHIWIKWIKENEDIINVYFHYTDYSKIQSRWIQQRVLPNKYIIKTDYTHVVPAYISLMNYAYKVDPANIWFCFLTESCCPIIPASEFRRRFFKYYNKSLITYRPIWWNPFIINRANLRQLKPEYHLGNNPWFILSRISVEKCLLYTEKNNAIYNLICNGLIANESIFAIMLLTQNMLNNKQVINREVFATDWAHMDSPTSPHTFCKGNSEELDFIEEKKKDKYIMFLRKVGCEFPDEHLEKYIFQAPEPNQLTQQLTQQIIVYTTMFIYISFFSCILFILTFPSFSTVNTSHKCSHWFIC